MIVVNRGSTDETRKIANQYTKHVYIHGPERAAQVNFGARCAKGKYLYRVDSDFVLEPGVVEECVRTCEVNKLDGVAVHNTSAEGLGFWADVRKLERDTYRSDTLIVAVRFFSKASWQAIGGFDESLYGPEDYDFHNRFVAAGFRWGRIDAIERHLGEPKTLVDIWHKHFYYGKQMIGYFVKHPIIAARQFIPIRSSYLRHFPRLLASPKLTIGLFIMTATKFTAGGLGFLVGAVENLGLRLFSKIRFWTGSFVELESHVPLQGLIIDLGCGYGILPNYLAFKSSKRRIIGIELDPKKVNQAIAGGENVSFQCGDITAIRLPKADCIIIADVLHHLHSYKAQDRLVERCSGLLKKHGILIISDVDSTPVWKLIAGRITDFVLYPGQPIYYRYAQKMIELLTRFFNSRHIRTQRITNTIFSHVIYICQKE